MVAKTCNFCEHRGVSCYGAEKPCMFWIAPRDPLSSEITRLEKECNALKKERDEALAKYQFMVDRACDQKLDGYIELGGKLAVAMELKDHARAEANKLRLDLKTAEIVSGRQVEKIESLEARCNQLQDELSKERSNTAAANAHFETTFADLRKLRLVLDDAEIKIEDLQEGLKTSLMDIQQLAAQYCPMDTWPAEDREKFAALQELIS